MPKTAARLLAPIFLAAALVLAAASPGAAAPPKAWGAKVCTSLDRWVTSIERRSEKTIADANARATVSKKSLVKMLAGARADTDKVIKQIKGAGAPSKRLGKQVATSVRDALVQVTRTLAQTRNAVKQADAKQAPVFIEDVRRAQDGLENVLERAEAIFASTTGLDVKPLINGFGAAGSCAELSARVTDASQATGPLGPVVIARVEPGGGPPGSTATYEFLNVDADGRDECTGSSAYRVEVLGSDGGQIGFAGDELEVPSDAPVGPSFLRVVCYFPTEKSPRPLMRSLCARFEVTAPGASAPPQGGYVPCPPTGRVLGGESVIAAQRVLGDAINAVLEGITGS